MEIEGYFLKFDKQKFVFDFESIGRKGKISKRIIFQSMKFKNLYNLCLGDIKDNNKFDDNIVSDNGDLEKVLKTVINAIDLFTESIPNAVVRIKGGNSVRNRLYRILINNNFDELSKTYDIFGIVKNKLIRFTRNEKFETFLIKRK